jgi:hypothetical protein
LIAIFPSEINSSKNYEKKSTITTKKQIVSIYHNQNDSVKRTKLIQKKKKIPLKNNIGC